MVPGAATDRMTDTTSATLLGKLRDPRDRAAWERFVELYTPLLFRWGRRLGLPAEDAADLVQETLLTLVRCRSSGFRSTRRGARGCPPNHMPPASGAGKPPRPFGADWRQAWTRV